MHLNENTTDNSGLSEQQTFMKPKRDNENYSLMTLASMQDTCGEAGGEAERPTLRRLTPSPKQGGLGNLRVLRGVNK